MTSILGTVLTLAQVVTRGPDHGPIYRETDFSGFPVDYLSTLSNLAFFAIIIYWVVRIWPTRRRQRFVAGVLPILAVGFIGGTIYHATRSHVVWLILDAAPIGVLALAAAVRFWRKIRMPWFWAFVIMLAPTFGVHSIGQVVGIPDSLRINLGYSLMAIGVVLPLVLYLKRHRWQDGWLILLALLSFVMAISMRYVDPFVAWQGGTHWLWHLFGAGATHFAIAYIYRDQERTAEMSVGAARAEV